VVNAFLAASRAGDFEALLAVLDPDVVLRGDSGAAPPGGSKVIRGSQSVARGAMAGARTGRITRLALVNGAAGVVAFEGERLISVVGFTIVRGKIVEIDVLVDPARLSQVDLAVLDD
jgi:RNA polymerase sigma-70 factor (ECF subfamily)